MAVEGTFYDKLGRWLGFGRNEYNATYPMQRVDMINNGRPEIIHITNENAYSNYLTTAQLYSVIQRRGYLLASGTWKHYRIDSSGESVEIENSPFVNLLENPNPLMSGNDFLRQWSENQLVQGNNYLFSLKGSSLIEVPKVIHNLPPSRIEISTTGMIYTATKLSEIIKEYRLCVDGSQYQVYDVQDILHTKMINGENPIKGESPLIPLYMEISNIRAAKKFRNVILSNNGALGILSSDGSIPFTSEERKKVEDQYRRMYGVQDGQNTLMITQGGTKWQHMAYPMKDMLLFEGIDSDFRTVIDHYGLNDNIFSREKGSTFTNLEEGFKMAYESTVIPDADEKAMSLSKQWGLVEKGEYLHLDYSDIPVLQLKDKDKADTLNLKATAVLKLQQSTVYSNDEIKLIAQLPQ